jgi:hypothetical protein
MCARWNDKFDPEILAARLETLKQKDAAGKFNGFRGFESHDYFTVLESSLGFAPEIPENEKGLIVNKAVFSVAGKGKITAKTILGEVSKEENAFLNKPRRNYTVATSLSIHYFDGLKKTTINGCPIVFSRFLPKGFDRKPIMELWEQMGSGENPINYTSVRMSVKAREEHEAFTIGIDALDLLRGIWNFYFNRSVGMRFSFGRTQLINKVTLGALHTLHLPNGKLAITEAIWYEPEFVNQNAYILGGQWEKLHEFEQIIRNHLRRHRYKSEVEDAIRRYTRALDSRDSHVAFVELWSVLEKLTSTLKAQYDMTIKRATFLYKDRDLHKQVLQHLRAFRNATVHVSQKTDQIETLIFQLKRYVESLLQFHITNVLKFNSMEEAGQFFDLSTDKSVLETRINELDKHMKVLNKAIKFLT